jgi:very-short-patch-repair endonuclease
VAHDVARVLGPEGWATWAELTGRVDRSTITAWLSSGKLVRPHPGVYASPSAAATWRLRVEAAVRSRGAVASHGTALALWGLVPPTRSIHLSVGPTRSGRGSAGVLLHRGRDLDDALRRVDGLPVTCAERSLVDAWGAPGELARSTIRAAAITAVRQRLCRPEDLAFELDRRPRLPRRAEFAELVQLLADGCRSELEIWGCLNVLRSPGMPPFVQQRQVSVAGERYLLDAAYDDVMLAVELDGAAWHGSRKQREKDIRRDALVATIGWQTLRFGFARMTAEPGLCRRDILAAYTTRRRLFGLDGVR